MKPNSSEKQQSTNWLLGRLLRDYIKPQWKLLVAAGVCMVLTAATTAAIPQVIKPIIDDIFVNKRSDFIIPIAFFTFFIFIMRGIATYGKLVFMSRVTLHIIMILRIKLFESLINQDLLYYDTNSSGSIISRFLNDAQIVSDALADTLSAIGKDLITAIALIAMLFYEDWVLASLSIIFFPLAIYPIARLGRRVRKISRDIQESLSLLTKQLGESFQSIKSIKAFSAEEDEAQRTSGTIRKVMHFAYKNERRQQILSPINEILGGIAVVIVIVYGGDQVISGAKTPGSFFAFVFALLLAYDPIKHLAKLYSRLQNGLAAVSRVFETLDLPRTVRDQVGAKPLKLSRGKISFQDVIFSYRGGAPALNGLTLIVEGGTSIALVGPSGAGKSTVFNLIPRFYDVQGGVVSIDGQDVREVTMLSLREQIALVSQEVFLFDDTIKNNIAYGRPDASDEEIIAAAVKANAHRFIAELPKGYDTPVGPRGGLLSGGQRQRIIIARAFLKDAPILLLDEATSALDSESEELVQSALERLKKGRTTIIIAHKLSTVRHSDQIFVLENGRIVESGCHEALLNERGAYANLYSLQFAKKVS